MSIFPDPPDREPSTGRLFRRAALLLGGLTVSYWLFGELRQREDNSLLGSAGYGVILAYADLVFTYAKPRWRRVVAPQHVLGLGLAGLIVAFTTLATTPAAPPGSMAWWWLGAATAITALPTVLVLLGTREVRRRNQKVGAP